MKTVPESPTPAEEWTVKNATVEIEKLLQLERVNVWSHPKFGAPLPIAPSNPGHREHRLGLLKLIDRQACLFSEAGPSNVKAAREKLHALVEEYASPPVVEQ